MAALIGIKLGGDGRNGRHRGRNFALNGTQGVVGVPLKKRFFCFRDTLFHSVTTQTQAVVTIYYHCIVFLLPTVCVMANLLLN